MQRVRDFLKRESEASGLPEQSEQWLSAVDPTVSKVPDLIKNVLVGVFKCFGKEELPADWRKVPINGLLVNEGVKKEIMAAQHRVKAYVHELMAFGYEDGFGDECVPERDDEGVCRIFVDDGLEREVEVLVETLYKDVVEKVLMEVDYMNKEEEALLSDLENALNRFEQKVAAVLAAFAVNIGFSLIDVPAGFAEDFKAFLLDPKNYYRRIPEAFLANIVDFLKSKNLLPETFTTRAGRTSEEDQMRANLLDLMACDGEGFEYDFEVAARSVLAAVKECTCSGKIFKAKAKATETISGTGDAVVIKYPFRRGAEEGGVAGT